MATAVKLKPCPWCGDPQDHPEGDANDRTGAVRVVCGNCGQCGPWAHSEAKADAAWNRRPESPEVDELRDENARLRADLLSARRFGETMIPNPLLQRQPFADDPADRFKERDD